LDGNGSYGGHCDEGYQGCYGCSVISAVRVILRFVMCIRTLKGIRIVTDFTSFS
jgi:hypothetical protein